MMMRVKFLNRVGWCGWLLLFAGVVVGRAQEPPRDASSTNQGPTIVTNVAVRLIDGRRIVLSSPEWTIIDGRIEKVADNGVLVRPLVEKTVTIPGTRSYKDVNGDVISVPLTEIRREFVDPVLIRNAQLGDGEVLPGGLYRFRGLPSGTSDVNGQAVNVLNFGQPEVTEVLVTSRTIQVTNAPLALRDASAHGDFRTASEQLKWENITTKPGVAFEDIFFEAWPDPKALQRK